ncbi:MAG TPA: hypothetical protein VE957_00540 [Terriglobales bacterium]|nr:hypothetical protein [Terriglobales bacterium]
MNNQKCRYEAEQLFPEPSGGVAQHAVDDDQQQIRNKTRKQNIGD